jgi:hypothetical protein
MCATGCEFVAVADRATLQHSRIEVNPRHGTGRSNARGSNTRHNSSTTGYIDYPLARKGISQFNDNWSPWPKHSRHQFALVHLGRATGDLPLSLLTHLKIVQGRCCWAI